MMACYYHLIYPADLAQGVCGRGLTMGTAASSANQERRA